MTRHDAERKRKILDVIAATIRARGYPPSACARSPRRSASPPPPPSTTTSRSSSGRATSSAAPRSRARSASRPGRAPARPRLRAHAAVPAQRGAPLPVIGEIAAGGPIEAYQDASETLAVPDILAPRGDAYVLRVRGDSMIEAHIADGDFVVIRPQETARDGDIVVAQVEENAVTLKRFFREKDRVRLQPANPNYPPQFYPIVRIQGKLIGVIRRLD